MVIHFLSLRIINNRFITASTYNYSRIGSYTFHVFELSLLSTLLARSCLALLLPNSFHWKPSTAMSSSTHGSKPPSYANGNTMNPLPTIRMENFLVDIDCNLFHKDFVTLNPSAASSKNDDASSNHDPFAILYHPSTREANVRGVFTPSSTISDSNYAVRAVSLYHQSDGHTNNHKDNIFVDVRTSVGVHPFHTEEEGRPTDDTIDFLNRLIQTGLDSNVVSCVGECGLDYSPSFPPQEMQIPWFQVQLDLACQYDLPLFLHERLAFHDLITCLDEAKERNHLFKLPPVVIHCFTGTVKDCQEYVSRDFYIGITGYILKKGDGPAEVWKALAQGIIPLNRLLIETDAPYMGFPGCRDLYWKYEQHTIHNLSGKARKRIIQSTSPNVPSSLPLVLRGVVNALNQGRQDRGEEVLTEEQVGRICTQNAINFFGFTKLNTTLVT